MVRHSSTRVELARLPSGNTIETTVHIYVGEEDQSGPTLYVQAAQHGREVNGTEVLRRFHTTGQNADLRGTVICVPVANPITFDRVSYTAPGSLDSVNGNMNRVWPGDPEGSLHERMANQLWKYAREADAIVDLHTGSPDMLSHVVYTKDHEPSLALAEAFGTDLVMGEPAGEDANDEWHHRNFSGKLRVAATRAGIPTITPELARHKQLIESAIETGHRGLRNVLRQLEMLDGEREPNGDAQLAQNHLGRVQAAESGLFRSVKGPEIGAFVQSGTQLGTVYDPTTYEQIEAVTADRDGVLYSLTRESTVVAGDTLASVALLEE